MAHHSNPGPLRRQRLSRCVSRCLSSSREVIPPTGTSVPEWTFQHFIEPGAQLAAFPLPRCKHNCPSFYHPLFTPAAALSRELLLKDTEGLYSVHSSAPRFQRKLNCWAKTQPALPALAKNSFQRETESRTLKPKLQSHLADRVLPTVPPALLGSICTTTCG